jgi:hypothetical protein
MMSYARFPRENYRTAAETKPASSKKGSMAPLRNGEKKKRKTARDATGPQFKVKPGPKNSEETFSPSRSRVL